MELINVPHIFHDPSLKTCLPTNIKLDDATVVYSLTSLIRSKISNFDKFVSDLDVKAFLRDNTILPCNCAGSGFVDTDQRLIVTGDLRTVGNNKWRKLFIKGPKCRGTNNI